MLQPPGSSSGRRSQPQQNSRRKAAQTPDDVVRSLQRLAPNKRCVDCSSRLPSCVNLTLGTFVCITCAGIHRELNQRVKGVGHSSFTAEEAEKIKETNNEQVNSIYMANYNPRNEKMKQPQDNSDPQFLKNWIRRKYVDRAWYAGNSSAQQPQTQTNPPPPRTSTNGSRQQRDYQPTVVKIPPKQQPPPPQEDLFALNSAPTPPQQQWDAFGTSTTPAQADPTPQPFPADFGSSQTKQQAAQAPASQQPMFQANFDQMSPQGQQNGGFANFPNQASLPQPTQPPAPQQQQSVANFGKLPVPMPQNVTPQATMQQQPVTNIVPQNVTPQAPMQQQQPASNIVPQSVTPQAPMQQQQPVGNFANFSAPQVSNHQNGTAQSQIPATLLQSTPPPQSQFGSFGQQPQFTGIGISNPQPLATPSPHQAGNFANFGQQQSPPSMPVAQEQGVANMPKPGAATNPIDALPSPSQMMASVATAEESKETPTTDETNEVGSKKVGSKYVSGQKVYYKSASYSGVAKILKVHLDDDLEPFYTIIVDGKEKQTDDGHLAEKHPVVEDIEAVLPDLSDEQLAAVKDLVDKLRSTGDSETAKTQTTVVPSHTPNTPAKAPDAFSGIPSPNADVSSKTLGATQSFGNMQISPPIVGAQSTQAPQTSSQTQQIEIGTQPVAPQGLRHTQQPSLPVTLPQQMGLQSTATTAQQQQQPNVPGVQQSQLSGPSIAALQQVQPTTMPQGQQPPAMDLNGIQVQPQRQGLPATMMQIPQQGAYHHQQAAQSQQPQQSMMNMAPHQPQQATEIKSKGNPFDMF